MRVRLASAAHGMMALDPLTGELSSRQSPLVPYLHNRLSKREHAANQINAVCSSSFSFTFGEPGGFHERDVLEIFGNGWKVKKYSKFQCGNLSRKTTPFPTTYHGITLPLFWLVADLVNWK
jgi:hypothetical protein